jgi:uncharacterized protein (TIGR03000 family)
MKQMLVMLSLAGLLATSGGAQEKKGAGYATILVKVPADATLKVGDYVSKQKGATRTLHSPLLEPGYVYSYVLEATWMEGGKEKKVSRTVNVEANKTTQVDLAKAETKTDSTKPKKTKDAAKPETKSKKEDAKPEIKKEKASPKDNVPPPGFSALFNGKDLTGWQGLVPINKRDKMTKEELAQAQKQADEKILPHWKVEDGIIEYDGKGNSLQRVKDYGDFELMVDWKILPKGDSGIYLRGNPQVQIWDDPVGSGGLYNNKKNPSKPLTVADKVGEWNTFHIVMKGDMVTIKLNGQLVVNNTPLENYWERGKELPARGPIELQHHGNRLWFKNIYIKELSK